MSLDLTRREVTKQIQRQFDLLGHYGDGTHVPALESQSIKLTTKNSNDFILIPCSDEQQERDEPLEGLSVDIVVFENENYFEIRMDSSYREIFLPFIADILICLPDVGIIVAFNETLEDWRELWAGKRGRLSLHQQRGLLGELIVLNNLICFNLAAAEAWCGPLRELHDFISGSIHLEVKTTNRQPPSVRISDISQVAPFRGEVRLALIVLGLEKGEECTLPSTIDLIRKKLEGSSQLPYFEKVLRRAGYRDDHEASYPTGYSISFEEIHWIKETSPVLDPGNLGEIPSTVRDISYTLDVFAMKMEGILEENWIDFANLLAKV